MSVQKVTLSINPEVFEQFKNLSIIEGISISKWVTAQMRKEIARSMKLQVTYKVCLDVIVQMIENDIPITTIRTITTKVYGFTIVDAIFEVLTNETE